MAPEILDEDFGKIQSRPLKISAKIAKERCVGESKGEGTCCSTSLQGADLIGLFIPGALHKRTSTQQLRTAQRRRRDNV
ncbi:Hypothetical predicted protein [Octopus vulgaris]|uniref:Uncharacterized protein n=1 Tax=Octopus vulgaris TaxID=6645 RepID=A0AA36FK73_OCTVU|nr:Hypothetical predicted protein [Octopus vulgaris]